MEMTGRISLALGALVYLGLGGLHGLLALRDVWQPRTFTPIDDSVRDAMSGAPFALHPRTDVWRAWLGFNLSHSLGLLVFGGSLLTVAAFRMDLFASSVPVQFAAIAVSVAYLLLSIKFWFVGPVVGSGTATVCLIAASILA